MISFKELLDSNNVTRAEMGRALHLTPWTIEAWYYEEVKVPKWVKKDLDEYFGYEVDIEYKPVYLPYCDRTKCVNYYKNKCMALTDNIPYVDKCPFYKEK